jgi:hypothetical protein
MVACVTSFLMPAAFRKLIAMSDTVSVANCMEGLKLLRWLRNFFNRFGP